MKTTKYTTRNGKIFFTKEGHFFILNMYNNMYGIEGERYRVVYPSIESLDRALENDALADYVDEQFLGYWN